VLREQERGLSTHALKQRAVETNRQARATLQHALGLLAQVDQLNAATKSWIVQAEIAEKGEPR
jgi:hypothetical protein